MAKKAFVGAAPLFDQLTQESPWGGGPSVHTQIRLTRDELLASIQRELTDLFGTHSSFPSGQLDTLIESAHNEGDVAGIPGFMGLPSLSDVFVGESTALADFGEKCAMMIRLYEPRLRNPKVEVGGLDAQTQKIVLQISAELVMENMRELVVFPLPISVNAEYGPAGGGAES